MCEALSSVQISENKKEKEVGREGRREGRERGGERQKGNENHVIAKICTVISTPLAT